MDAITVVQSQNKGLKWLAQAGYIAKGVVYVVLGLIAVLAASGTGKSSTADADKDGVFRFIKESAGGNWLLIVLGIGLVCYSAWRLVETYHAMSAHGKKRWNGLRYFLSAIVYLSVAVTAFRMASNTGGKGGDAQQQLASELLDKPLGQWLVALAALIIACVGVYQLYYGLSEKFRKHVQKLNLHNKAATFLLLCGKIGYTARGIVWLIIAFLLFKAAIHSSSSEAGDTGRAFSVLEDSQYGTYLLGILGAGLIAYGLFNFVRARYEEFNQELR